MSVNSRSLVVGLWFGNINVHQGQISSSSAGMVLNLNVQDCSFHVLGFG